MMLLVPGTTTGWLPVSRVLGARAGTTAAPDSPVQREFRARTGVAPNTPGPDVDLLNLGRAADQGKLKINRLIAIIMPRDYVVAAEWSCTAESR
ncbi:hypothetical protein BJX63DRAFT_354496 [Aspergillus granulosus]|uniref:Uncharacterized protein n=1 Tax=Aspergillus granulosus TaxID=176169 RepID=A0ABR4H1X3_9EURO